MTIQLGGGSTEDQHTADALLRDSGRNVFVYLYETFAASLFDYCAGLLPDPVAACDAVQDSLVAVDGQISELPDPDQLRLWLYAAARRACQNRLAARGPRPASPAEAAGPDGFGLGAPDGFGLGAPGPAGPDRETLAIVSAALARLDASDREVLNLAYRHGIEGGDLAGVLGLPARRARALLAGACARFAQSASVVEVLRAGPAGCHVAPGIVGSPDPAAPAALRAGPRFSRHVGSCPDCARVLAGRSFEAGLIARVPLEVPVGRLRLRIARTAVALGTYRRKVVDVPDLPGGPFEPGQPAEPARPDPRARRAEPAVPVVPAAPAGLGEADDTGVMAPVRARGAEPAGPAVPAGLGEADDTGVMAPVRARGAEPAGPAVPAGLGEADDTGVMAPVRARGAERLGPRCRPVSGRLMTRASWRRSGLAVPSRLGPRCPLVSGRLMTRASWRRSGLAVPSRLGPRCRPVSGRLMTRASWRRSGLAVPSRLGPRCPLVSARLMTPAFRRRSRRAAACRRRWRHHRWRWPSWPCRESCSSGTSWP